MCLSQTLLRKDEFKWANLLHLDWDRCPQTPGLNWRLPLSILLNLCLEWVQGWVQVGPGVGPGGSRGGSRWNHAWVQG